MGINKNEKHTILKWSCVIEVQARPRSRRPLPRIHRCSRWLRLDFLTSITYTDGLFNFGIYPRPSHVHRSQHLHLGHSRRSLVQLLQHGASSWLGHHDPGSPQATAIVRRQLRLLRGEYIELWLTVTRPTLKMNCRTRKSLWSLLVHA